MNDGLTFVPQAITQREVWANAPIVLRIHTKICLRNTCLGIAGGDAQLRWTTTNRANLRRRQAQPLTKQGASISFQAVDKDRLISNRLIVRVERGHQRAGERKRAAKVIRVDVCDADATHASAKLKSMHS